MDIEKILKSLDPIQSQLNYGPCRYHEEMGREMCLAPSPLAWQDMDPKLMCQGCAAYWHLGAAVNVLLDLQRIETLKGMTQ